MARIDDLVKYSENYTPHYAALAPGEQKEFYTVSNSIITHKILDLEKKIGNVGNKLKSLINEVKVLSDRILTLEVTNKILLGAISAGIAVLITIVVYFLNKQDNMILEINKTILELTKQLQK